MRIEPTGQAGKLPAQISVTPKEVKKQEKPETPAALDQAEIKGKPAKAAPPPEVLVLREGGLEALVKSIDKAEKFIDLKVYIFTAAQRDVIEAMKRALKRGVKVRIMVEDQPFFWQKNQPNPSQKAIDELVAEGAEYKPDNPEFSKVKVTHEKSLVIDGKKGIILTGNIALSTFTSNLDMGAIIIRNPQVVKEMGTIYNADWNRKPLPPLNDTGLVLSPENAREKITGLIQGASKSIHIMEQGFTDKQIMAVLGEKLKEGVKTELLLTDPVVAQNNIAPAAFLKVKGAKVFYLNDPYLHAKAITINADDQDHSDDVSFVGSQNLSYSALSRNRELGYIFADPTGQVEKIFSAYVPKAYEIPSQQLVTENNSIGVAFKTAFQMAEKTIDLQTSLLSDSSTVSALSSAAKKGVKVKVLMPKNPFPWDPNFDLNIKTGETLTKAGAEVKWSDPTKKPPEGSLLVVDNKVAVLASDALTYGTFNQNVAMGLVDIAPEEVKEFGKLFDSDWNCKSSSHKAVQSGVVVSPDNARQKILSHLDKAQRYIDVETGSLTDPDVAKLLSKKAKAGLSVRIVVKDENNMPEWKKKILDDLKVAGAQVEKFSFRDLRSNLIEVDGKASFIGAQEMTPEDLDEKRGFGLIIQHPEMVKAGALNFRDHLFIAAMDQVQNVAYLEKKFLKYPQDRKIINVLEDRAKYGVKSEIVVGNPNYSYTREEIASVNRELRYIASLDPEKDLGRIARYYNLPFKPYEAKFHHAKLVKAIRSLPPQRELLEVKWKDYNDIKEDYLRVDERRISLDRPSQDPGRGSSPEAENVDWKLASG